MSNVALLAVEQVTSAGFSEGAITVDFPSGIVVGEIMVLALFCAETDSISTPSGWTVVSNDVNAFQGDVDTDVYVYKKVVASGDVSAGSLSVDVVDGGGQLAYACFRISGYNTVDSTEQVDIGDSTAAGTTDRDHTVSITPSTAGSLLILCAGWDGNAGTTGSYTATGSPTFTEVLDAPRSTTDVISVAYALLDNTTEITTLDFITSANTSRSNVLGFIVRTRVDSSGANALLSVSPTYFSPNGSAGTTGTNALLEVSPEFFDQSGRATSPTQWTNPDKPSTPSWSNPDK